MAIRSGAHYYLHLLSLFCQQKVDFRFFLKIVFDEYIFLVFANPLNYYHQLKINEWAQPGVETGTSRTRSAIDVD